MIGCRVNRLLLCCLVAILVGSESSSVCGAAVVDSFEWQADAAPSWQTDVIHSGCSGGAFLSVEDPVEGYYLNVTVPAGGRCAAVVGFNESPDTVNYNQASGHYLTARIRIHTASGLNSNGQLDPMRGGVGVWFLADDRGGDLREPAMMITETAVYRLVRRESDDTFTGEALPLPPGFDPIAAFHDYTLQYHAGTDEYEYLIDGVVTAAHPRDQAPVNIQPSGLRIGDTISGRSTRIEFDVSRIAFGGGGVGGDACGGLLPRLTDGAVAGSTSTATNDGTASCGDSNASPDVWYDYVAPATGTLQISSCGSQIDTVLSVSDGCGGTELACNNDCGGTPCGGTDSCLVIPVAEGATYKVRVAGNSGTAGAFQLQVIGPPLNGSCPNASPITSGPTQGRTTNAAGDDTGSCGVPGGSPAVWYQYTAPGTGPLLIDTCNADFDTVLSVYQGDCGSLSEIACSQDCSGQPCFGPGSCLQANVQQGQRYLIRVAGVGGASGTFTLNLDDSSVLHAVSIGSRRELFVDSHLIGTLSGTRLRPHPPRPAGTALQLDAPWEGRFAFYTTVLKDGGIYRMYYRGWQEVTGDAVTCYAESPDGINWSKPSLGLHEVGGTLDNNVILGPNTPGDVTHNFCPFVDKRPGVPMDERMKGLGGGGAGLIPYASPDGIHWTALQAGPVVTGGAFDSQNVSFWSESENQYVCYYRTWRDGYRRISRQTSPDFLNWSGAVEMGYNGAPVEHLYTNQTGPYFRAPHIYIALGARFLPGRRALTDAQCAALDVGSGGGGCNGTSDTVLMSTRGGDQYDRTFMGSYIRPGMGYDNWVARTNYAALGVVPTGPQEMSIYVNRDYGQLSAHVERMTLRPDGFVSVYAGPGGGEFITRPLVFTGTELTINYSTSAAGDLRVELQDAAGQPIAGYALADADIIIGDEIDRNVSWGGRTDVSALQGQPVRLRFVMKLADLYSLQFR